MSWGGIMDVTQLLFLIGYWCEQTNVDLFAVHECRKQIVTCILKKDKVTDKQILACFLKTKEPGAEAI